MILGGIDYSYTSPTICVYNTDKKLAFENLLIFNYYVPKKKKGYLEGQYGNIHITAGPAFESQEERFSNIRDWAIDIIDEHQVEEVVLEGYAMGSKVGSVFDIAENTALLKQYLYENRIPFIKQPPTSVKKSFTGKGNAKKHEIVAEFEKRFGVKLYEILGLRDKPEDPEKPIDDIADSVANLLTHPHFAQET